MRVYLAGPMTGRKFYNIATFSAAAGYLRDQGHEVSTPFEANSRVWQRHYGRDFNAYLDRCDWGDPVLREMMAEDIVELLRCDAIALLPGWRESKGTQMELALARLHGLEVLTAAGEPLQESILEEAQRLVHGPRRADYGHPAVNHGRTAGLWAAYLGVPITPEQVCMLNILQKVARSQQSMTRDTLVDIAGYAANIELLQDYQPAEAVSQ